MRKYGTSFCDVTVTLILHEKIGNIVFLKLHICILLKIDMNHFYPKIPTGAQISTQRPTLRRTTDILYCYMAGENPVS